MSSLIEKGGLLSEAAILQEGKTWDDDRVIAAETSRRTAYWIAAGAIAMACVGLLAGAVSLMTHKVELRVVRVNETTGQIDIMTELTERKEPFSEAVTKHFVVDYVNAREGYSRQEAATNYEKVGLFSTPPIAKRYLAEFHPDNPKSPLNVYGKNAVAHLEVRGVSFVTPEIVAYRYTKKVMRPSVEKPEISHWIATVQFKYGAGKMKESDRLKNPLGFQVVEYRTDPDSLESK